MSVHSILSGEGNSAVAAFERLVSFDMGNLVSLQVVGTKEALKADVASISPISLMQFRVKLKGMHFFE